MKLKLKQVTKLRAGLVALDGHIKLAEVDGKPVPVQTPYDFTGSFRWNIRKNLRLATDRAEDIEKVRIELIRQHSSRVQGFDPFDKSEATAAKLQAYEKEFNGLLEKEEEFAGFLMISQAQLNLDKNPIPGSVLEHLDPLLDA